MTNDLKNFLEKKYKEQEAQYETSTFINWLKESDKELVNFVLDLVEKKMKKQELKSYSSKDVEVGFNYAKEVFSTIINNFKVK